jgi:hypothetical protein
VEKALYFEREMAENLLLTHQVQPLYSSFCGEGFVFWKRNAIYER